MCSEREGDLLVRLQEEASDFEDEDDLEDTLEENVVVILCPSLDIDENDDDGDNLRPAHSRLATLKNSFARPCISSKVARGDRFPEVLLYGDGVQ